MVPIGVVCFRWLQVWWPLLSFMINPSSTNSRIVFRRKDRGGWGMFTPVVVGFRFCLIWWQTPTLRSRCVRCCVGGGDEWGSWGCLGEVWMGCRGFLD